MDDLIFKQNFIGKDGFVWWVGQVAPQESWKSQLDADSPDSWGVRYKVRIMGYHPYSTTELPDEDLPWAHVLMPPGNSGSGQRAESIKLSQGDVVIGFFLDGTNGQVPMILGTYANTNQMATGEPLPFQPFSGYSETIAKPNAKVTSPIEANDTQGGESNLKQPPKFSKEAGDGNTGEGRASYTSTDGAKLNFGCGTNESINDIRSSINGLMNFTDNLKLQFEDGSQYVQDAIKNEIGIRTKQIQKSASGIVGTMIDDVYEKLIPVSQSGLKMLYNSVESKIFAATKNKAISHLAGVAAQTSMLGPLKTAQNLMTCLANNIINDLGGMVGDLLTSVVDNVANFVNCVADQVLGGIMNGIIGKIGSGMSGVLGGLGKILGFFSGFNVEDIIRNSTSAIAEMVGLRGCNEEPEADKWGPCEHTLGYGPSYRSDPDLGSILSTANKASALSTAAKLAGFPLDGIQDITGALDIFKKGISLPNIGSSVSNCYAGLPQICEPPKIRIFGGGGSGASAIPILGSIIGDSRYQSGSLIGVKVTNPGGLYEYPPFVEVVDNCNKGIGAVARSILKDGKVESIYIVSEGEGYPVGQQDPVSVIGVTIINPGTGYSDGDTATDNNGTQYDLRISNGSIIGVTPINITDVDELPVIRITTKTGSGALLLANIDTRPEFQGEVKQVIDCVT